MRVVGDAGALGEVVTADELDTMAMGRGDHLAEEVTIEPRVECLKRQVARIPAIDAAHVEQHCGRTELGEVGGSLLGSRLASLSLRLVCTIRCGECHQSVIEPPLSPECSLLFAGPAFSSHNCSQIVCDLSTRARNGHETRLDSY